MTDLVDGASRTRDEELQSAPAPPPHMGPVTPEPPIAAVPRKSSLFRDLLTVLVMIGVAVLLESIIERTSLAHQLSLASYGFLQERLSSSAAGITLIDISELKPQVVPGRLDPVTPRTPLRTILLAVANHRPKAIAIDIDFSPDARGYVHPDDPVFLDFCLRLREARGIPIILGVGRRSVWPTPEWLGESKYQPLAATMIIPNDLRRLPHSIRAVAGAAALPSISAAIVGPPSRDASSLAQSVRNGLSAMGLIEQFSAHDRKEFTVDEFLIDYSAITTFTQFSTLSEAGINAVGSHLKDNIVIIGDGRGNNAADMYTVMGTSYPGMFLHAAAAYTLMHRPLYEVTHRGRIVMTAVLLGIVLVPPAIVAAAARRFEKKMWIEERLSGTLTAALIVGGCLLGGVLIRSTRILWDGFILSFVALALHRPVEDSLYGIQKLLPHLRAWMTGTK